MHINTTAQKIAQLCFNHPRHKLPQRIYQSSVLLSLLYDSDFCYFEAHQSVLHYVCQVCLFCDSSLDTPVKLTQKEYNVLFQSIRIACFCLSQASRQDDFSQVVELL